MVSKLLKGNGMRMVLLVLSRALCYVSLFIFLARMVLCSFMLLEGRERFAGIVVVVLLEPRGHIYRST